VGAGLWELDAWWICLAYAYPQCDTMDFEAMHKWALKQFMRTVAHGRHVGAHLSQRHTAQFLFTQAGQPEAPVKPRYCHCGGDPCTHPKHVHADMPGLAELEDGTYAPLDRFTRSADVVQVSEAGHRFRHALRVFIGECNGTSHRDSVLPEQVYRAKTMQLSWHNPDGSLAVCVGSIALRIQAYAWHMPGTSALTKRIHARHMPGICLAHATSVQCNPSHH